VDIRGCGDSSLGWDGYSRTDIAATWSPSFATSATARP